jgi:hypothetical protein
MPPCRAAARRAKEGKQADKKAGKKTCVMDEAKKQDFRARRRAANQSVSKHLSRAENRGATQKRSL